MLNLSLSFTTYDLHNLGPKNGAERNERLDVIPYDDDSEQIWKSSRRTNWGTEERRKKSFRQYEETIKIIEEERNDLRCKVMLLEQKLANKEKEEEAKQCSVEESRQKVTIEKEKKQ